MKELRIICLIMCVTMLTAGFIAPVNAADGDPPEEGTNEETETSYGDGQEAPIIQLFIVTDGDFITIGDGDVIGELELDINQLGNQVILLNNKINDAQETANVAFLRSDSALATALNNQGVLEDHDQTLVIHYDELTDTIDKLWVLRDEVVAFEEHYTEFVDETSTTLSEYDEDIDSNYENTELNKGEIDRLQNNYDRLNTNFSYLIFIFLLVGGGVIVFITYKLSKRHYANKNKNVKISKQPTLTNYTAGATVLKNAKKGKAHIRVRKIGVNKRKSPIRAAKHRRVISKVERLDNTPKRRGLNIKRNPERSPIRFMFSFFHKL